MKSTENLIEQLKALPYFDKTSIRQLGKQLGIADTTIDTYISRFLRRKEIVQLKNGLYVPADFLNKNRGDLSYSFYLANILRKPSYVNSWTALQYYNLATESIYTIISITPKVTRTYKTKTGTFPALCATPPKEGKIPASLSAELNARRKEYEYYRDKLLTFKGFNSPPVEGCQSKTDGVVS
ncbi:MAG: hypothetical protein WCS33_02395 [Candidatus Caldatribacteriota bacterium]